MDIADATLSTRKPNPAILVQGIAFILLYILFYGAVFPGLVNDWQENSTFSYGILIPFIAAYFVWDRWGQIRSAPILPAFGGVIFLVIALMLGLIGKVVGDSFTERLSLIFALASSIYLLFGRVFFSILLFPVCYLALMIPLPYVLTKEIAYQLRFFDAKLAANALQMLGIPVYRETYFLHLPNISLEVADMCAGLASIFALFALGTFYVYFLPVSTRRKALLLLSTFPIAIFANLVRIIVVSALAYYIGPVTLEMLFHRFSGTSTFLLALVLLIGFGEFLRRKRAPIPAARRLSEMADTRSSYGQTTADWKPFLCGAAIFLCALSAAGLLSGGRNLALRGSGFNDWPSSLGPFAVSQLDWQDPYADPKAESSISRLYTSSGMAPIEAFVGYKGSQNASERLQSPKLILGEHWNFVWVKPARVELNDSARLEANWMLTRRAGLARLVIYWYQFGATTEASELGYRINLAKRLILERRSDGSVVRLATVVGSDETTEKAQMRLITLARHLYPELVRILPQ